MTGSVLQANPAFRRYWLGHCSSVLGTNMREFTMLWLVHELTDSLLWLSAVPLARVISMLACTVPAGVLADRLPRRLVILYAESGSLIVSVSLAVLSLGSWLEAWFVVVAAALLGALHAFEAPARNVLVHELVSSEGLFRALSLMSIAPGAGRIMGYVLGGLLYAQVGPTSCFLIDAASYLILLLVVLSLPQGVAEEGGSGTRSAGEALVHCFRTANLRRLLILLTIVSVVGGSYRPLMAAIADKLFSMDVTEFGLLQASAALGSVLVAVLLGRGMVSWPAQRVLVGAGFVLPVALAGLAMASGAMTAAPAVFVLAAVLTSAEVSANASLQQQAPEGMRGRVVAFYTILVHVYPLAGWALALGADHLGLRPVLVGLAGLVLALMAGESLAARGGPELKT